MQLMKPMPGLDDAARAGRRARASSARRCARSSSSPTTPASKAIVDQQFEVGRQILDAGLVPIIEPEVDIHSPQKAEAEALLKAAHPRAPRPARRRPAGDAQADAARARTASTPSSSTTRRCCASSPCPAATAARRPTTASARNPGVIASFSRALTEGLSAQQSDEEFDAALDASIDEHLRGVAAPSHARAAGACWHA